MIEQKRWIFDCLVPLVVLMCSTALFWTTDLDVKIEALFFDPTYGWNHGDEQPWRFLYEYGTIPAQIFAWASFVIFIGSFWLRHIKPYRLVAIFFVLVMVVGPGLLVNTTFKQRWGRPRPLDIENFSGQKPFLHAWEKGAAGEGESFPSGHASMGFYWLTPFFFLRRFRRKLAIFFLLFGLGYGLLIGLARMIQGSHFPSDVLWAFGFVYFCGLGFYHLLKPDRALEP